MERDRQWVERKKEMKKGTQRRLNYIDKGAGGSDRERTIRENKNKSISTPEIRQSYTDKEKKNWHNKKKRLDKNIAKDSRDQKKPATKKRKKETEEMKTN